MYCSYCGNFTDTDFCSHCQEYIANCEDEEFDYHDDDIEMDIDDDDYRDDDDDNSEWKEHYTHE
jgi:hypothetical protein